jgi:hypothetical protein
MLAEARQMGFTLEELIELIRQRDTVMKSINSEV